MALLTKEEIESGRVVKASYVKVINHPGITDFQQYKVFYTIEGSIYMLKLPVMDKVATNKELLDKIYLALLEVEKKEPIGDIPPPPITVESIDIKGQSAQQPE